MKSVVTSWQPNIEKLIFALSLFSARTQAGTLAIDEF
jgi:hypothetical protein